MLADLAAFVSKLEGAIDETMQTTVAEGAKKALEEAAYTEVYDAYSPKFLSRRGSAGGIPDQGNMEADYGGMTLTIRDEAPWQQLWGGSVPGGRLAEAIATGDPRYNMGKAGPRPFHQEAERQFAGSGEFERLLAQGLRAHGFAVK